MLEAVSDDAEGQGLYPRDGVIAILAVALNARQGRHFGQPAAISFAFELDGEGHPGGCRRLASVRAGSATIACYRTIACMITRRSSALVLAASICLASHAGHAAPPMSGTIFMDPGHHHAR